MQERMRLSPSELIESLADGRRYSSLVDVLAQRAEDQPHKQAYVFVSKTGEKEQCISYGSLDASAHALADRLAEQAAPGDRALLIFPTGLEFVVAFFACLIAGMVAVPMMPPRRNASHDASAAILADCEPHCALTSVGVLERTHLEERLPRNGVPLLTVNLDALDRVTRHAAHPSRTGDELAFLQYTSGSTSTPKGVMVTHRNLLENLEMIRIAFGNHQDSTHVSWIPLYHDMGLILNVLQAVYLGSQCVLMPPAGFLHRPLDWLRAIHHYRGEVVSAPNFAFDHCVDRFRPEHMQGVDLSCWRVACNGAEPVRADTLERFAETFGPYGFDKNALYPAYGMAEATLMISGGRRGNAPVVRRVSARVLYQGRMTEPSDTEDEKLLVGCGRAVTGLDMAIVDPSSRQRLDNMMVGEIWVKGPNVALGYWRRTDETARVFRAQIAGESEGTWLRTGDLGCFDNDGELYIVGRLKDVIIIRGVNHYPQDIEATVVASHPALRRDCGVAFGVSDGTSSEQLIVVQEVDRHHLRTASSDEIIAAIRAAVVNEHEIVPRAIVLIEPGTIPKTTSGKIQRALTRQRWSEDSLKMWGTRNARPPAPCSECGDSK